VSTGGALPPVTPLTGQSLAASAAEGGHGLQAQKISRGLIRRMAEPAPKTALDLDTRGIIRQDMARREQADVFRNLRTQLQALARGRNFVTVVAPVGSGSGASFVATNLAAAFAFDESKTALLIDCNLRKPVLHARLGVGPARGGLTDYLENQELGAAAIIYPTGIRRLRLIPAGEPRETSGEYFSSWPMQSLVAELRARYPDRYLVLDAPAINGSPDARILSELADMVVVVARHGVDTTTAVREAVGSLDPARVAGVVFNGAP
jgi:Mrp family chromosome partitioning ATPase